MNMRRYRWKTVVLEAVLCPAITYFLEQYAPGGPFHNSGLSIGGALPAAFRLKPQVILNARSLWRPCPSTLESRGSHLIHHGVALAQRHPEWMVQTLALLDARYACISCW